VIALASIPVHEAALAAFEQCVNYRVVGGMDAIVLHVNALSGAFDIPLLERLVAGTALLRDRVFINPERLPIRPMVRDPHFVATLHRAHVSNYAFARRRLAFDWFCMDASNSLFVRGGLREALANDIDGIDVTPMAPQWFWRGPVVADPAWEMFWGDLYQSNVEGTFLRTARLDPICTGIADYEARLAAHGAQGHPFCEFPREEILFQTLYRHQNGPCTTQPPYVWMRWERSLVWQPDEVRNALATQTLAPGKYAIKRVGRDVNDWVRVMVGRHFGYRAAVAEAIGAAGVELPIQG
jgi:hypothetical protein